MFVKELILLRVKEIEDLIIQLNTHSWSSKREDAAWRLGLYGNDAFKAVPHLIRTLNDSSGDVQLSAAEALGKIGSEKALKPLQKLVFSSEYNMVLQNQCLLSIAKIRTSEASEFLMGIIGDTDYDSILRRDAALALGRMRSKAKKEVFNLIKIYMAEEEDFVKEEIIVALGKSCTKAKRIINFLVEIIYDNNLNWQLRNRAVEALGRLNAIHVYRDIIKVLVYDQSAYVRNTAVKTIRRLSLHYWDKKQELLFELIRTILLAYELEESPFVLKQIENTLKIYEERLEDDTFEEFENNVKEILEREEYITEEILENWLSSDIEVSFEEIDESIDFEDYGIDKKIITKKFPIKMLFLGAAPQDQSNLNHEKELNLIKRRIASKPNFRFESQFGITSGEFISVLQNTTATILHFSAHGSNGELALEDASGQTDSISIQKIASLVKIRNQSNLKNDENKISCILFSSCSSDFDATEVANYVDCVIVMTDTISIDDANNFALGFYESFCNGSDIESAFNYGLAMMDPNEKQIPKLLPENKDFNQLYLFEKEEH